MAYAFCYLIVSGNISRTSPFREQDYKPKFIKEKLVFRKVI